MRVIILALLVLVSGMANAEGFLLPKSFSISKNDLPKIEEPVKKEEVIPVSLIELVRTFEYDYPSTFQATLSALAQFDVGPLEYDTSRGQIKARISSGKDLFVMILPSGEKLTHVRITPVDGKYDFSLELIEDIFKAVE